MFKKCSVIVSILLIISAGNLYSQESSLDLSKEGELTKYINPESTDLLTKLEVLQQSLYTVEQQLTNLTFMQQHGNRIKFEKVFYPDYDGSITPGYVFTPVQLENGKKYPAIVVVHGGYHSCFTDAFFEFIDMAISKGYILIFPEYRGSRGYGAKHYNMIDYGGKEVDDVVAAADYLGKRSYIDSERIGIFGRSHGGMITLLAIERYPKKFKAAVDLVGLVDFIAYMSYKPQYRRDDVAEQPGFEGKLPFENLNAYMNVSPINFVDKIETPVLVHATTGDKIVPVQLHALRLIDALKANNKTFEYKIYENAPGGHIFNQGDSEETKDSYKKIFEFLGKYLNP